MKREQHELSSQVGKEKGKFPTAALFGRYWLIGFALLWCLGCEVEEGQEPSIDDEGATELGDDSEGQDRTPYFATASNLNNSFLTEIDLAATLQNSTSIQYPFCIYTIEVPTNTQTENTVQSWATNSMNTWIAPLAGQTGWRVTKATAYRVQRTSSGCPTTHNGLKVYTIEISNLDGADNYMPGFKMRMGNWGINQIVVTHEMGHGLGMGDLYAYGTGQYKPLGQPAAVMNDCWTVNGVLQKDDIDGIRFLWARLRGASNPCPSGYVVGGCEGNQCSGVAFCVPGASPTGKCAQVAEGSSATLSCPSGQVIGSISFASYGLPTGSCPSFATGTCHASTSKTKVESLCLNKQSCTVAANNSVFGDPCSGKAKKLAVTYNCRATTTALAAKDFVGYYERTPVLNDWHKVNITLVNNALSWKNAAGISWSLTFASGVLKTGSDCPYGVQTISVEKTGTNTVTGLRFSGELYQRR